MKNISLKKLASLFLALALAFTCVAVPTNTVQAAKTKAIKVTNVNGSTKTLKSGKGFTLTTNYSASKLIFKSSKKSIATVSKKGKVTAKKAGTAKITITLRANKKVKKTLTIKVKAAEDSTVEQEPARLTYDDFDVSGLNVPMSYR